MLSGPKREWTLTMHLKQFAIATILALSVSGSAWAQSGTINGVGDAVEHNQPSASGVGSTEAGGLRGNAYGSRTGRSARPAQTGPSASPYVTPPAEE